MLSFKIRHFQGFGDAVFHLLPVYFVGDGLNLSMVANVLLPLTAACQEIFCFSR